MSDKGQIAIPVELRRDLGTVRGDTLHAMKRKDDVGFTLIRINSMDELFQTI